jgi:autotransporter translocation and assembly factor TamB
VVRVIAMYEVRQAGRAPFDIRVVVGGTLQEPRVSLESDAQPTLSQSDLIAFLAFGQSSSTLLSFQGGGVAGGGQQGSSLAGNVAELAGKQVASIAIGALMDELKSDLTRATRADVLNITPAELPPDLSLGTFGTVIRGTELQIGKYLDRRTFVMTQLRPSFDAYPGLIVESRLRRGLRLRATLETRYLAEPPSLTTGLEPKTIQIIGGILTWSLRW